ncbi:MAG: addiction module toxin RelE [Tannerella sp.]|jgi:mRNA-degrading endonuclease RelE of RelBE toxin-antitoxin system|nr:addiction module toxin RelE [Tannerella sp.]
MNYRVVATPTFQRELKRLCKKYRSLKDDLAAFKKELQENPDMGDDLGDNTRKIRMAVSFKNKGKRGGARVITYHLLLDIKTTKIYLLSIYDKGEQENVSGDEIRQLKKLNGL